MPLSLLQNLLRWFTEQATHAAQCIRATPNLIGTVSQRLLAEWQRLAKAVAAK